MPLLNRRQAAAVASAVPLLVQDASAAPAPTDFPREDSELAHQVVGASHFDGKKVRALVNAYPSLANASWDWGFGDFETALGAASHTGQRAIAEYLLEKGARLDLFAAAMLGMTDVVKAMVAVRPGVQRTWGPHGIPLLAHARAGGAQARATLAYLESLGDAGDPPATAPVSEERRKMILGHYELRGQRMEVKLSSRGLLQVIPGPGQDPKNLEHKGDDTYFPSGVPNVGFRFAIREGKAVSFEIQHPTYGGLAKRID